MKAPAVRIIPRKGGGFDIRHWSKFIGWRADQATAEAKAREISDRLSRNRFLRNQKRLQAMKPPPEARDPDAPEVVWCTRYSNDGHTKRGWLLIQPDHPQHWAQALRRPQRIVDGLVAELRPPGFQGVRIIEPTLPPLPWSGEEGVFVDNYFVPPSQPTPPPALPSWRQNLKTLLSI